MMLMKVWGPYHIDELSEPETQTNCQAGAAVTHRSDQLIVVLVLEKEIIVKTFGVVVSLGHWRKSCQEEDHRCQDGPGGTLDLIDHPEPSRTT